MTIIYGNVHIWQSYTGKWSYMNIYKIIIYGQKWSYMIPYMIILLNHMWLSYMEMIFGSYMSKLWVHIWTFQMFIYEHSRIWLTIYDWLHLLRYMIPYMIDHIRVSRIWLIIYDWQEMIDSIWLFTTYDTIYDWSYMIWSYMITVYDLLYMIPVYDCDRIWLTVYDCPYMIVVYEPVYDWPYMMSVYEHVYDWLHMNTRIWSYEWTIYDFVYDYHIWTPPQIIYGQPLRWCTLRLPFFAFFVLPRTCYWVSVATQHVC